MKLAACVGFVAVGVLLVVGLEELDFDTWVDVVVMGAYGVAAGFLARGWWILLAPALLLPVALGIDLFNNCDSGEYCQDSGPAVLFVLWLMIPAGIVLGVGVLLRKAADRLTRARPRT